MQRDECLSDVHHVQVQLAALNNIPEPYDNIRIGQTLYVAR